MYSEKKWLLGMKKLRPPLKKVSRNAYGLKNDKKLNLPKPQVDLMDAHKNKTIRKIETCFRLKPLLESQKMVVLCFYT